MLSIPNQIERRGGCNKVFLSNSQTAKHKAWDVTAAPLQLALAIGFGGYPPAPYLPDRLHQRAFILQRQISVCSYMQTTSRTFS
jgi:hypothetical protein